VVALSIAGCATTKVYDKTVPLEQSSTLALSNDVGIIDFNDKKIALMGTIIIPADFHYWILRYKDIKYDGLGRATGVTQYDIVMSYTFLPKHTYYVTATASGGTAIGQIRDITNLYLDFPSPDPTSPRCFTD